MMMFPTMYPKYLQIVKHYAYAAAINQTFKLCFSVMKPNYCPAL